jgi:hypothetical protein
MPRGNDCTTWAEDFALDVQHDSAQTAFPSVRSSGPVGREPLAAEIVPFAGQLSLPCSTLAPGQPTMKASQKHGKWCAPRSRARAPVPGARRALAVADEAGKGT